MGQGTRSRGIRPLIVAVAAMVLAGATVQAADVNGIDVRLPKQEGTSVSGRITKAPTGDPVKNASVTLVDPEDSWDRIGQYQTDADGRFEMILAKWAWGDHVIFVRTEPQPTLPDGFYAASAAGHYAGTRADATVVTIGATDITGVNVRLPVGRDVLGRITRAANGTPIRYATVAAFRAEDQGEPAAEAETAADGSYRLRGLGPATYHVYVRADSSTPLQSGCYRSAGPGHFTADCDQATDVVVAGSNVSGKDVALPKGFTLRGRLTSRTGEPICASIDAYKVDGIGFEGGYGQFGPDCGDFRITGLSEGRYRIQISPDFEGNTNIVPGEYSGSDPDHWSAEHGTIVVVGADGDLGTVRPPKGKSISGIVKKADGSGVNHAYVWLTDTSGGDLQQGETDKQGRFRLVGLGAGDYLVSFEPNFGPNECGWYREAASNGITQRRSLATVLSLGPSVSGITVTLRNRRTYSVAGRITRAGGAGVPGVFIEFEPVGDEAAPSCQSGGGGTDENGRYVATRLRPGRYTVLALAFMAPDLRSGWYREGAPGNFTNHRDQATPVRVGP